MLLKHVIGYFRKVSVHEADKSLVPEIFGPGQMSLDRRKLALKMEKQRGNQPLNTGGGQTCCYRP